MNILPSAVFLDRDGTIIEDTHYLSDPDGVMVILDAADAIARINAALVPVIVVTNQSGIGRGYYTMADYDKVNNRLQALLAARGARIDAWYLCPHAPEDGCECRKPGLLLFKRAAAENDGVDLSRSLYIGDRRRDLEPGIAFGGPSVLVPSADTPPAEIEWAATNARVAPSLSTAIDWYICTN